MSEIKIFDAPLGMGRYCIIDEDKEAETLCKQTGIDLRLLGRLDYAGQVMTFVKDGEWLVVARIAHHLPQLSTIHAHEKPAGTTSFVPR